MSPICSGYRPMSNDPFAPIGKGNGSGRNRKQAKTCIVPVPDEALEPPKRHPKLGTPSTKWDYRDGNGGLLGFVFRFEEKDGGKSFRPLVLFETGSGKPQWRWERWPAPRPLYGLDKLAQRPKAPVLICEGEKAADAAARLAPDHVAITSLGGSKGAAKADWSPLKDRDVVLWPDADEPGAAYAEAVSDLLQHAGVGSLSVITPPDTVSQGWDAADALTEGRISEQVADLIASAQSVPSQPEQTQQSIKSSSSKQPRQRDALLAAADCLDLWHSPEKRAYASIPVGTHIEHWPLESAAFKRWLSGRFYKETGGAPATQQLCDTLRVLDVKAINEGPCHRPELRTDFSDDALWIDLGDASWRAVKVTKDGWSIVSFRTVKFLRPEIMAPLPEPEPGYMIEELRSFLNVDDDDFILVTGWLVAALWGKATSFPVLTLGGEQGSGKSTVSRLIRTLVDPCIVETAAPPRDERDLIVAAGSSHVLAFDNVSRIENWFSDAVCRLATGAGFLTRKLHTDNDASWFQGSRPVIMNGIPSLTDRADLAERSLTVRLKRIDENTRRPEDDWWSEWTIIQPRVLGALCDALSGALRHYDAIRLSRMPRMAAFAKLMAAAGPSLGWEPGDFDRAYASNRAYTSDTAFEADPVAVAVRDWMIKHHIDGWEGTATDLLAELNTFVSEDIRRSRFWPAKVNALGKAIDRAAPLLRQKHIHVLKRNTSTARLISISVVE